MTNPAPPSLEERLSAAGVRPTVQRVGLARLLLTGPARHVTAAEVWTEAKEHGLPISLATVYNTLNEFVTAGLLRAVERASAQATFDTNVEPHHHAVDEVGRVFDVPAGAVTVSIDPASVPEGAVIEGVEVFVRVRRA